MDRLQRLQKEQNQQLQPHPEAPQSHFQRNPIINQKQNAPQKSPKRPPD